jgi:hypothetical protein
MVLARDFVIARPLAKFYFMKLAKSRLVGSSSKRVPYSRKRKPHHRAAERLEYQEDFFGA